MNRLSRDERRIFALLITRGTDEGWAGRDSAENDALVQLVPAAQMARPLKQKEADLAAGMAKKALDVDSTTRRLHRREIKSIYDKMKTPN